MKENQIITKYNIIKEKINNFYKKQTINININSLMTEYKKIKPIYLLILNKNQIIKEIKNIEIYTQDNNSDIKELAIQELKNKIENQNNINKKINYLIKDYNNIQNNNIKQNINNIYIEIRAATGGVESAFFVKNLSDMYIKYAKKQEWNIKIININNVHYNAYKEIIIEINGKDCYKNLQYESGIHRVQRIPETESQGRLHTSTCTVAILPKLISINSIQLKKEELEIQTYKASGAGGQHVNKTNSAIRIKHIPTNIIVECQDERSQHKNKEKALSILKTKIIFVKNLKQSTHVQNTRKNMVKTGGRSEKIRTYNYHKKKIIDHRINFSIYNALNNMEYDLDKIIKKLIEKYIQ